MAAEIGVRALARRDDVDQRLRVEHVVAHRGEAALVVAGHRRWFLDLLVEVEDPPVGVGLDDAELAGLVLGHGDRRHGHPGADLDVVIDHLLRVHAVDVVGTEHADEIRILVRDQVEVLVDRVGRAGEPERAAAHLRRHGCHVLAEQRREPPRLADVTVEAVALVLGEHDHLEQTGIGEVRQGEVDQPVAAGERHGRFGPVVGEWLQSLALAAGEDDHEDSRFGHGAEPSSASPISRSYSATYSRAGPLHDQSSFIPRPDSVAPSASDWRDVARLGTAPT